MGRIREDSFEFEKCVDGVVSVDDLRKLLG